MPDELTNGDETTDALVAADRLIDRLKDDAFNGLKPEVDQDEAFGEIVEELETAPEIDQVHDVIGKQKAAPTQVGPGLKKMLQDAGPDDEPEHGASAAGPAV